MKIFSPHDKKREKVKIFSFFMGIGTSVFSCISIYIVLYLIHLKFLVNF